MSPTKIHPAIAIPLMLLASPFLAALIGIFWVLTSIGSVVLGVLVWPFQVVSGLIFSVLGGGR